MARWFLVSFLVLATLLVLVSAKSGSSKHSKDKQHGGKEDGVRRHGSRHGAETSSKKKADNSKSSSGDEFRVAKQDFSSKRSQKDPRDNFQQEQEIFQRNQNIFRQDQDFLSRMEQRKKTGSEKHVKADKEATYWKQSVQELEETLDRVDNMELMLEKLDQSEQILERLNFLKATRKTNAQRELFDDDYSRDQNDISSGKAHNRKALDEKMAQFQEVEHRKLTREVERTIERLDQLERVLERVDQLQQTAQKTMKKAERDIFQDSLDRFKQDQNVFSRNERSKKSADEKRAIVKEEQLRQAFFEVEGILERVAHLERKLERSDRQKSQKSPKNAINDIFDAYNQDLFNQDHNVFGPDSHVKRPNKCTRNSNQQSLSKENARLQSSLADLDKLERMLDRLDELELTLERMNNSNKNAKADHTQYRVKHSSGNHDHHHARKDEEEKEHRVTANEQEAYLDRGEQKFQPYALKFEPVHHETNPSARRHDDL